MGHSDPKPTTPVEMLTANKLERMNAPLGTVVDLGHLPWEITGINNLLINKQEFDIKCFLSPSPCPRKLGMEC
jgi:hypothetical protein